MKRWALRGKAYVDGAVRAAVVDIEDGRIVSVGETDSGVAEVSIDLDDRDVLLPAAVDMLAAARDWNEWERDTVETATKAALAGGITTLCDQPNTQPRIMSPEMVRRRVASFEADSFVDFGIQSHPPVDAVTAPQLKEAGAFGLTFFQWDLRPWNYPRDIDDSRERFHAYHEAGLQAMFIVDELALRETPLEAEAETYAVDHFLRRLDPDLSARAFVTQPRSVAMFAEAKTRFPNLHLQIAPHYLLMSGAQAWKKIGFASAHSPPLRSESDVDQITAMARDGMLDVFVSHHTPHRTVDKYNDEPVPGEFKPKRGFTSLDFAYPLLLSRLGVARACEGFCAKPAHLLALPKGAIRAGFDADLVIARQEDAWIDSNRFESKGKVTPFIGDRVQWQITKTYLRGVEVFDAATRTFQRTAVRRVV